MSSGSHCQIQQLLRTVGTPQQFLAVSTEQSHSSDATDIASATDHTKPHVVTAFGICTNLASVLCRRHYHIKGSFDFMMPQLATPHSQQSKAWIHASGALPAHICCVGHFFGSLEIVNGLLLRCNIDLHLSMTQSHYHKYTVATCTSEASGMLLTLGQN